MQDTIAWYPETREQLVLSRKLAKMDGMNQFPILSLSFSLLKLKEVYKNNLYQTTKFQDRRALLTYHKKLWVHEFQYYYLAKI